MHVKNIEHGLRKTMVAVFKSKGLSQQAAEAKATTNLAAASTQFERAREQSLSAKAPAQNKLDQLRGRGSASAQEAHAPVVTDTAKVTNAEIGALRKVSAPVGSNPTVASKTSASIAIGLGAVAKWARGLK